MKEDKSSRYEVGYRHVLFQNQFFGSLELVFWSVKYIDLSYKIQK